MSDHVDQHSPFAPRTPPARHRVRRIVLTGVASAVIVGGGGAYAYASGDGGATTAPSAPASGAPAAPGPGASAPKPGPHIDGTVKSVDGTTVTVTDPDGFTRSIDTSPKTSYDGVSSPLAAGTKIHATGTVASDGTSLDATKISAMPQPPKGGPPAPGKGGPAAPPAPSGSGKSSGSGSGSGSTSAPAAPSGAPAAPSGAPAAPSDAPSTSPTGS